MNLRIVPIMTAAFILTTHIACEAETVRISDFLKTGVFAVDTLTDEQSDYINAYSCVYYSKNIYELDNAQSRDLSHKIFINTYGGLRIKTRSELESEMSVREKNLVDYRINKYKLKELPYEKRMYFSQYDERWSSHGYGTSSIGVSGCATVCLAMMLNMVSESKAFYPDMIAEWADASEYQYYVPDHGTSWKLLEDYPWEYGLAAEQFGINSVGELLEIPENEPIILAMSKGVFTDDGHFIVVIRLGDVFSVFDPANIERTLNAWTADALFCEMRGIAWKYRGEPSITDDMIKMGEAHETGDNDQRIRITDFEVCFDENSETLLKTRAAIFRLVKANRKG